MVTCRFQPFSNREGCRWKALSAVAEALAVHATRLCCTALNSPCWTLGISHLAFLTPWAVPAFWSSPKPCHCHLGCSLLLRHFSSALRLLHAVLSNGRQEQRHAENWLLRSGTEQATLTANFLAWRLLLFGQALNFYILTFKSDAKTSRYPFHLLKTLVWGFVTHIYPGLSNTIMRDVVILHGHFS